jgi:tRNA A22 N-methylase
LEQLVHGDADPQKLAQDAFRKLAKSGRSWRRLGHLVDLACLGDDEKNIRTLADVGCDHGLLAISLSLSGRFKRVIGVDSSERALQDGAIALHQKLLDTLNSTEELQRWRERDGHVNSVFPVEFRVGSGLEALQPGEADAVCIAGMGVDSMIQILEAHEMDRVGCKKLILQPTNARPRNLLRLYDFLALMGWGVRHESIEYFSTRWYISSSFELQTIDDNRLRVPGHWLAQLGEETPMKQAYAKYVHHHQSWIKKDARSGAVHENDKRWLAAIGEECA